MQNVNGTAEQTDERTEGQTGRVDPSKCIYMYMYFICRNITKQNDLLVLDIFWVCGNVHVINELLQNEGGR